MTAVDVVQEIVEVAVESGAATSVWPIRKGDARTKATKTERLVAASRGPIRVEGDARLDFARDGERYNVKFLDVDVLDECDCRRGKHHCVRTAGIVRREHEHLPKDSVGQEERRVCGAIGCA